ncbi:MAG: type II toxin-antitoxin system RelE/ParE family toxin [Gammaproteobacteria bacterium]|nr:type II toxin-antitoxin system RelE/ParE family toxin [Gammaproteobacteria bacterium]
MRADFHPAADAELAAAKEWYAERSEAASRAFTEEVARAVESIMEGPERWRVTAVDARRYVLPMFPFSIVYRTIADGIVVLAVAHHRRRPGYWQGR